jgi:hypothetical protein
MEAVAAAGCPLCRILLHSAQTNFLDEWILEKIAVTLSRAMLDSHQGVCLAVHQDDVSHTTFFRVPELWSKSAKCLVGSELWFVMVAMDNVTKLANSQVMVLLWE